MVTPSDHHVDMNIQNENDLKGRGGNEWKMAKVTLLIRFCQIYSYKLPKRLLSSFKISKFSRFLSLQVLTCGFLLYALKATMP